MSKYELPTLHELGVSVTRQWEVRAPASHAPNELKNTHGLGLVIPKHNLIFNSIALMIIRHFERVSLLNNVKYLIAIRYFK